MSEHPFIPKSNSKIVPPFIPKPKESLEAENARLKEEVKRLEAVIESYKESGIRIFAMMDEERRNTSHLKAEVERLREAGDEMAGWVGKEWCPSWVVNDWNTAKEGKQP